MSKILADKDVQRLLGIVLIDASDDLINPNGIELRLGKRVYFYSTKEEIDLPPDHFLRIHPSESVTISSIERIDFTKETVQKLFPSCMLMGVITPTTTMTREGILHSSTKIDAGFRGNLNWGLRNGSTQDIILQYGEPMFKLTFILLEDEEIPEIPYGGRPRDSYQDTDGIRRSARKLPADLPSNKIVSSKFGTLDPAKQLREAGYPFNHIGTELSNLHGKFEVVSTDVRMMRDEFKATKTELSNKIQIETSTLSGKIDENQKTMLDTVNIIFSKKAILIGGTLVSFVPVIFGVASFLGSVGFNEKAIACIMVLGGVGLFITTLILTRNPKGD